MKRLMIILAALSLLMGGCDVLDTLTSHSTVGLKEWISDVVDQGKCGCIKSNQDNPEVYVYFVGPTVEAGAENGVIYSEKEADGGTSKYCIVPHAITGSEPETKAVFYFTEAQLLQRMQDKRAEGKIVIVKAISQKPAFQAEMWDGGTKWSVQDLLGIILESI